MSREFLGGLFFGGAAGLLFGLLWEWLWSAIAKSK